MILPGFPRMIPMIGGAPPPVFRSSAGAGSSGGFYNVNKPTGTQEGDILIAWGYRPSQSVSPTLPSGWSSVYVNSDASSSVFVAMKIAGASEPANYTFSFGSGFNAITILCYEPGTGVDEVGTVNRTSFVSTTAANSITASEPGVLLALFGSGSNSAGAYTGPSGMTARGVGAFGSAAVAVAFDLDPSNVGATGNKTITWNNAFSDHAGLLVQIY